MAFFKEDFFYVSEVIIDKTNYFSKILGKKINFIFMQLFSADAIMIKKN